MNGMVAAIAAGVLLGLFQTLHGQAEELPVRTATVVLLIVAVAVATIAALLLLGIQPFLALTPRALLLFALAGAIHFSGGWMLMGVSQRSVGVGITGLLIGAAPVFTALIAVAAFGERLTPRDIVGVVLVVTGVGLASWK